METHSIPYSDDDADLFCLHYVFLTRINASLEAFCYAWIHISTEGNRFPLHLYTEGSNGSNLFDEIIDLDTYGTDHNSPLTNEDEEEETTVTVPDTDIPLSQASLLTLQASVNPLERCYDFSIQLYKNCVHLVYQLMQSNDLI